MIEQENNNTTGRELIDAAQDAVIHAADGVEHIIVEAKAEIDSHHDNIFYMTAEFWVGMAFVLVVVLLFKPLKKALFGILDKRINSIIKRISDADGLKTEARELLAEYEEKVENVDAEVDEILKKSKKEITAFKNKSIKEIENQITSQERYIEERIQNIKNRASEEIINLVSSKSITALKKIIISKLSDKEKSNLIDNSIELINKLK